MMTDKQLERLPPLAREIIENGREIAAFRAEPVVPLFILGHLIHRRRELAESAHKRWGQVADMDGKRRG